MRVVVWTVVGLVCAWLPSVSSHDTVEEVEFETKLITDEQDDAPYTYGGYDLGDLYFAEVFLPDHGDGFYFHIQLFGPYKAGTGEWRVTFSFDAGGARAQRSLWTTDGRTFASDFKVLKHKQSAESTDIQRAFVSLHELGLTVGARLADFKVQSFVAGDLRDEAPGPLYAPGSGGAVPIVCTVPPPPRQCPSKAEVTELNLEGPSRFVAVAAKPLADGFQLNVRSLVNNGQHVHLDLGDLSREGRPGGWKGDASEGGKEIGKGGTWSPRLTLTPVPDAEGRVAPLFLNVTTDIGGRVGLVVRDVDGAAALSVAGADPVMSKAAPRDAPSVGPVAALVLALLGSTLRRRTSG